jgi:hypothetical protein
VKWQGCSIADTTWEQLEEFKRRFPEVEIKDELFGGKWEKLSMLSKESSIRDSKNKLY